jgi:hypothetical protein
MLRCWVAAALPARERWGAGLSLGRCCGRDRPGLPRAGVPGRLLAGATGAPGRLFADAAGRAGCANPPLLDSGLEVAGDSGLDVAGMIRVGRSWTGGKASSFPRSGGICRGVFFRFPERLSRVEGSRSGAGFCSGLPVWISSSQS